MRVTKDRIESAKKIIINNVVKHLVASRGISSEDALRLFLLSRTYKALQTPATKVYTESSPFVIEQLEYELAGNWDAWMKD